jgi:prepilin-type N-terminal cleavage/methylation domain-containing protein
MKNKKGLTLVEVVVAMGLFGIIMVTLFPAFIITNLMNNISKEFTDASYFAQSEMEELYSLSKVTGSTALTSIESMGYTCSSGVCTDNSDTDFNFSIVYTTNSTISDITNVQLTVTSKVGDPDYQGNRSQIELYIKFGG